MLTSLIKPLLGKLMNEVVSFALAGALFSLLNKITVLPEKGSFTSLTAGAGVALNSDSNYQSLPTNCARFEGIRYVENLLARGSASSEDVNDAVWSMIGAGTIDSANQFTLSGAGDAITTGNIGYVFKVGEIITCRCTVSTDDAAGKLRFFVKETGGSVHANGYKTVGTSTVIHTETFVAAGDGTGVELRLQGNTVGLVVTITDIQIENKSSNDAAEQGISSEYASANVLSSPYHGCGADGVKALSTEFANTVLSNVLTEATGATLTGMTGQLIEPTVTNLFLNSFVPVTQNITTTAQNYTLSVEGAGDITLSGTATGTATDGSPLTVTATAGTLTLTKNGVITKAQLETGDIATSFIETAGVSAARNKDNVIDVWPTGRVNNIKVSLTFSSKYVNTGDLICAICGYVDANNYVALMHDGTNFIARKRIAGVNYDATKAQALVIGTEYVLEALFHDTDGVDLTVDAAAGTGDANTTDFSEPSKLQLGSLDGTNNFIVGNIHTIIIEKL